jgi:hypothetical protein
MTLVVPNLTSNGLTWQLQGRGYARQCLLTRSLLPVLANPGAHAEEVRLVWRVACRCGPPGGLEDKTDKHESVRAWR